MFQDRRRAPRYAALLVGEVRFGTTVNARSLGEAVCTNISRGGGFFASRASVDLGARMVILLRPSGALGPEIVCQVAVTWSSPRGGPVPQGFGVTWLTLTCVDGEAALREFAHHHLHFTDDDLAVLVGEDGRAVLDLRTARPSGTGIEAVHLPDVAPPTQAAPQQAPAQPSSAAVHVESCQPLAPTAISRFRPDSEDAISATDALLIAPLDEDAGDDELDLDAPAVSQFESTQVIESPEMLAWIRGDAGPAAAAKAQSPVSSPLRIGTSLAASLDFSESTDPGVSG